jgi:hypothetical protein
MGTARCFVTAVTALSVLFVGGINLVARVSPQVNRLSDSAHSSTQLSSTEGRLVNLSRRSDDLGAGAVADGDPVQTELQRLRTQLDRKEAEIAWLGAERAAHRLLRKSKVKAAAVKQPPRQPPRCQGQQLGARDGTGTPKARQVLFVNLMSWKRFVGNETGGRDGEDYCER